MPDGRAALGADVQPPDTIATRLDHPDITVQETIALLHEGQGLDHALRTHLERTEGPLRETEATRNLPTFMADAARAASAEQDPRQG